MADKYRNFEELSRSEAEGNFAVDTRIDGRRRDLVVIAPHGGKIEPGTDALAREIAGDDLAYYAFLGLKPANNRDLHITSARFDEPQALELATAARHVLTIHGAAGAERFVMVGGGNPNLVQRLRDRLQAGGFEVREPHGHLAGQAPENICNRCSEAGAQLELSHGLRELLREDEVANERFCRNVRSALLSD